jgi:hypothetical protein
MVVGECYEFYGIWKHENDDILVLTFKNLVGKFLPMYNYHKKLWINLA